MAVLITSIIGGTARRAVDSMNEPLRAGRPGCYVTSAKHTTAMGIDRWLVHATFSALLRSETSA